MARKEGIALSLKYLCKIYLVILFVEWFHDQQGASDEMENEAKEEKIKLEPDDVMQAGIYISYLPVVIVYLSCTNLSGHGVFKRNLGLK